MPANNGQTLIDHDVEEKALRDSGILGRGAGMGNVLVAMDYDLLPPEAIATIRLIINGGPFLYPRNDGKPFGNKFGDLPSGDYLEFTVPTPGARNRGARRIVARKNGVLFFTACHYERIQGNMTPEARVTATAAIDEAWRNGFYVITGLPLDLRQQMRDAIHRMYGL